VSEIIVIKCILLRATNINVLLAHNLNEKLIIEQVVLIVVLPCILISVKLFCQQMHYLLKHVQYVRTNNPSSAYASHILNNRHEYGTAEETLELLKSCHKSARMNCWETFYIQLFHQHNTLISEQQFYDVNPLYAIADIS
jgi:hypothetical protein